MVPKFLIFFVLISSVNCRRFNRFHEFNSPGIDGTELNQPNYGNNEKVLSSVTDNQKEEDKKRERRNIDLTRDRYSIQNVESYAPTETPILETEQIHFEKEIKEAKAALYVIVGYIALTVVVVTAISCCALSLTVIIVSLIWSKKRTSRQQPPYFPPPPPPQWLSSPPPPEIYKVDSYLYQNDSQDVSN